MSEKRNESFLADQGRSETASTVGNVKFGESGAMSYRVTVQTGAGLTAFDVVTATGDQAAEAAHKRFLGAKVLHIEPTPQNELEAA